MQARRSAERERGVAIRTPERKINDLDAFHPLTTSPRGLREMFRRGTNERSLQRGTCPSGITPTDKLEFVANPSVIV